MRILPFLASAALVAGITVPAALAGEGSPCSPCPSKSAAAKTDLVDTAVAAGSFKTLVAAVQAAGLVETLKGPGPFTVFAPTDEAFASLPAGTVEGLLKDKAALTKILTYHVVPGRVLAAEVSLTTWAKTVQGQSLLVQAGEGEVRVDGAKVVKADVLASNGVIHVIDRVILPRADIVDTADKAGSFKTLLAAAKAAGLVDTLKGEGPFTVFAPTDEAFAKLPAGTVEKLLQDKAALAKILTFHVVPARVLSSDLAQGANAAATVQGQKVSVVRTRDGHVTVNGATVVKADVLAGNGVIHVIDTVILPQ